MTKLERFFAENKDTLGVNVTAEMLEPIEWLTAGRKVNERWLMIAALVQLGAEVAGIRNQAGAIYIANKALRRTR